MSPVLDLQRRAYQSGRIRLGQVVATGKQDKAGKDIMRPVKLSTFRFTSPSRYQIDAAAEAYRGEVRPWDNRGRKEWEVVTAAEELFVAIPPAADAISQWYEMWTGGGCQRRCDSQREQKSGGPCLCPHASDPGDEDEVDRMARERHRLSKLMPPQACGIKTRLSVVLPDLPDVGVWRLDTGGFYAAGELIGKAELMALCRDRDLFLPARLWIDHRVDVVGGQTRKYPVLALEIQKTFRQVATGELESAGWAAQLPPGPGDGPRAITAAPSPDVPRPGAEPSSPEVAGNAGAEPGRPQDLADDERRYRLAQVIANQARTAATAAQMRECAAAMAREQVGEEWVYTTDDQVSGPCKPLEDFLRETWRERAKEGAR
jgi:hypothetical protein